MTTSTTASVTTSEVLEEVSAMSESDRKELAVLASNDLYIMAKGVLGYKDINEETHGRYIRFIQSHPKKRRLGLMPRAHLKTTIEVADCVRLPTLNVDHVRILIAAETATLSKKILDETTNHWESNGLLRSLYPAIAPTKFSGPGITWSSDMATLPRNSPHKDPTWQAIGVGGAVIGGHFTRIKADDLIGYEAARSRAKMEATISWNNNIESLLVDQHEDIIDWTGTRWGVNDLYHHIMEAYGTDLAVFSREAIENGKIIFPQLHTMEEYERIQRISPEVWFAQYCNNPKAAGKRDLPHEMIRTFRFSLDGNFVETAEGDRWAIEQLDRVILCDPNSGQQTAPDEAAIVVTGTSPSNQVFTLDAWSGRPTVSGFVNMIVDKTARWRPRAIGIEQAGQQATLQLFEEKRDKVSFYLPMPEPLKHKNTEKEYRIRSRIEPLLRSGRLYLLPTQQQLRDQIADFPESLLFDQVDALAYGPDLWRKPLNKSTIQKTVRNMKMILSRRHSRTGY